MQQNPDDLVNQGASAGRGCAALLSEAMVQFIESGLSIVVGVVAPGGRAQTGRALAVRVIPGGRVRLIYTEEGNDAVTATAQSGGPIAVTVSAPMSHRTLQIKGFSSRLEVPEAADEMATRQQTDAFGAVLAAIGYPPSFVQAFGDYRSAPLSVLSFPAEEAFEQTPGPGAGRSI